MRYLILLMVCTNVLFSQVNTEKFKFENFDPGYHTVLGLSVDWEDGNSKDIQYIGEIGMSHNTDLFNNHLILNLTYAEGQGTVIKNKGLAYFSSELKLFDNFNPELFFQKNFHKYLKLKDRYLAGFHFKINFFDIKSEKENKPLFILNLGPGLMYEYELIEAETDYSTETLRSTNYLNIYWNISDKVHLYSTTYYQFAVEDIKNHRILSDLTLSVPITNNFKLSFNLHYRFDYQPPPGLVKYDIELVQGISYKFSL